MLSKKPESLWSGFVHNDTFKREGGIWVAQRLLSLGKPRTAIFATNDVLGEAAMFAIRERGLKIPDDISFLLFDDVPWALLTTPRITVVSQPAHSLGFIGLERLVQRLEGADRLDPVPLKMVLQPQLIVRESCAAHPRCGL
jgi:LacI family transcriptional regulator